MKRIGVIGVVINQNSDMAIQVQKLLSEYSDIIIGRMGVPDKQSGIGAISIIVKGSNESISALSGKLGKIGGVHIKSAITSMQIEE